MKTIYRLVAYSRETERLIGSHDVSEAAVAKAKRIAGIPDDDDGCGDYPLDGRQAREIGKLISVPVKLDTAEYFLEPYVFEANAGGSTHE